jgi:flagellar assembly protein FliH
MTHSARDPQKFTFDRRFDSAPTGGHGYGSAAKVKRFFTPEEMEAAKLEAYARGRGSLEAIAAQSQSMALSQIAEAAMTALNALDQMAAEARAEALSTGMLAARRIADAALSRYPIDTLEETISHCLAQVAHEPRVVIRIGGDVADELKSRIDELAQSIGFAGRIIVTADPRLSRADCRLEWSDGGAERDAASIADRIEAVLARFIETDARRAAEANGA